MAGFSVLHQIDPASGTGRLRVTKVVAGGPSDRAGLRVGDVIHAIDGRPVPAEELEIFWRFRELRAGTSVGLAALRSGERLEFELVPTPTSEQRIDSWIRFFVAHHFGSDAYLEHFGPDQVIESI